MERQAALGLLLTCWLAPAVAAQSPLAPPTEVLAPPTEVLAPPTEVLAPPTEVLAPPTEVTVTDYPWDGGTQLVLQWRLSADDRADAPLRYKILRCQEAGGLFQQIGLVVPGAEARQSGRGQYVAEVLRGEPYYFRILAVGADGSVSPFVEVGPATARRQLFDGQRLGTFVWTLLLGGAVVYWIAHARSGRPLKMRAIPGLEAVDEAVGRATEMGRSCLFIPGIQDMNDIQTIAGMTILARVAQTAAQYDARVEVPTSRSLVMTTARETVQAAYLTAGRPDAYNEDLIYYVTDEQFGYVAYLSGLMVRERPAACFYMGSFFAESLILAETGNAIGAIQVAGTAQPAQLPFFVAACDYTLIGEEFFAASAYLSGDPEQLGSLKGQDVGKLFVGVLVVVGCAAATLSELTGAASFQWLLDLIKETML